MGTPFSAQISTASALRLTPLLSTSTCSTSSSGASSLTSPLTLTRRRSECFPRNEPGCSIIKCILLLVYPKVLTIHPSHLNNQVRHAATILLPDQASISYPPLP